MNILVMEVQHGKTFVYNGKIKTEKGLNSLRGVLEACKAVKAYKGLVLSF